MCGDGKLFAFDVDGADVATSSYSSDSVVSSGRRIWLRERILWSAVGNGLRGFVPVGVIAPELLAVFVLMKLFDFFFWLYLSRCGCGSDRVGAKNLRPLELPVESERFRFCGFFGRIRVGSVAVVVDTCDDVPECHGKIFFEVILSSRARKNFADLYFTCRWCSLFFCMLCL